MSAYAKEKTMLVRLAAVAAALLAAAAVTLPAGAVPRSEKNIVQTAQAAGQFKTLLKLATAAGLANTLSTGGPFTVFAPTDAAFAKVPKKTLNTLLQHPKQLRAVLLYHVVKGKVPAARVVHLTSARTLSGPSVRIHVRGTTVYVNGAKVVKADVAATNGVIHVINRVLIPPKS
jgi:uncharacterized surface protein with fasciclin (FAS1) repeats